MGDAPADSAVSLLQSDPLGDSEGAPAAPSGSASALERDVPEQRRGEREHAADVLPGGGRRDELAPQGVGHVVVRELLDLLGELLAPGGIGFSMGSLQYQPKKALSHTPAMPAFSAGDAISAALHHVWRMFQPPSDAGVFMARRATSVPQSIACTSTLQPIFCSRSPVTSATAWSIEMLVGSNTTIGLPSYPASFMSWRACSKSGLAGAPALEPYSLLLTKYAPLCRKYFDWPTAVCRYCCWSAMYTRACRAFLLLKGGCRWLGRIQP